MKLTALTKPIKPVVDGVLIELTLEEAETLRVVVANIAGSTIYSRRKHTDDLLTKLQLAGILRNGEIVVAGSIHFKDEVLKDDD